MPNWTYNRVHGSNKAVKLLLDVDGHPTFQNILPSPIEINLLNDSNVSDDKKVCDAIYHAFVNNDDDFLKALYKTGGYLASAYSSEDAYVQAMKEHYEDYISIIRSLHDNHDGYYDWYNWNIHNWGCKWDAADDFGPYAGTEDEIEFQTPWSPPEGVISKMAELYPDIECVWHCDEESCAFSIDYVLNGDGTYSEQDAPPEYYFPYIIEEEDLLTELQGLTTVKDVLQTIDSQLGEATRDINKVVESDGTISLELTVYDWNQNGGGELYSTKIGGLKDE